MTAWVCDWHMYLGPEVSIITLFPVTSLSSPAAHCLCVLAYKKCPSVILYTAWEYDCAQFAPEKMLPACFDSRQNSNSRIKFLFSFSVDFSDMWKELVERKKTLLQLHKYVHTHTHTLLGRYRSMSKFNWAADRLGWTLTSHAYTFSHQLHTQKYTSSHLLSFNSFFHKTLSLLLNDFQLYTISFG